MALLEHIEDSSPPVFILASATISYHHLGTFTMQANGNSAARRLAGGLSRIGVFDAMYDGVAQHVLERRHHPFQEVAVQLAFHVVRMQLDVPQEVLDATREPGR
ncbi:MAG: hypothetical protein ABFS45_18030 [Pseudomonadota bacterium]